jgi:hypothetical protein
MKNFILLLASLLPMILIGLFADPTQGAFTANFGSILSTFIAGILGFGFLKRYGEENGMAASIGWLLILALGLFVASKC